jgi:RHS repeat-associated protein
LVDDGRTQAFAYDALGRLSSAVTNGSAAYAKWGLSESYDQYGNRLSRSVTAGNGPSNSLLFATTPAPPANPPGGAYTNRPDGYSFGLIGELWYSSPSPSWLFTSYYHDNESGNEYGLARAYLSRFGRFCSADPVMGIPADPQSWNRYAYLRNDPVNRVDPDGMSFFSWLVKAFSFIAKAVTGLPHGPGSGTPPIFDGGPYSSTQALLDSIYHPLGQSRGLIIQNFQSNPRSALQTDCLKFAGMTEQIARAAATAEEFMDKMASTFTAANNSSMWEMYDSSDRATPEDRPDFLDSGFKPEFLDGSNQVRLFVGGLVAGYRLGTAAADVFIDEREQAGNPDTRLNAVSTNLGSELEVYPGAFSKIQINTSTFDL